MHTLVLVCTVQCNRIARSYIGRVSCEKSGDLMLNVHSDLQPDLSSRFCLLPARQPAFEQHSRTVLGRGNFQNLFHLVTFRIGLENLDTVLFQSDDEFKLIESKSSCKWTKDAKLIFGSKMTTSSRASADSPYD